MSLKLGDEEFTFIKYVYNHVGTGGAYVDKGQPAYRLLHGLIDNGFLSNVGKSEESVFFSLSNRAIEYVLGNGENNILEEIKRNFNEKSLEKYIIQNIGMIEEGMTFIDNQVKLEDGVLDILARDKDGILCIIELKVVDDCKDLIFQCSYYPTQFDEKTRMIAICPSYHHKVETQATYKWSKLTFYHTNLQ